jgi:hypothetical protein
VTLRDETLTDHDDANFKAIQAAYKGVVLTNLDGRRLPERRLANVSGGHGPAFSRDPRSTTTGQRVVRAGHVLYGVTGAERYIQSLGFSDVNNESQDVRANVYAANNSLYIPPGQDHLRPGRRGRRGGRRGDLARVRPRHPGRTGAGLRLQQEAGSIGEGFGDYWATSMAEPVSDGSLACVADWDSHLVHDQGAHCLRRVN